MTIKNLLLKCAVVASVVLLGACGGAEVDGAALAAEKAVLPVMEPRARQLPLCTRI